MICRNVILNEIIAERDQIYAFVHKRAGVALRNVIGLAHRPVLSLLSRCLSLRANGSHSNLGVVFFCAGDRDQEAEPGDVCVLPVRWHSQRRAGHAPDGWWTSRSQPHQAGLRQVHAQPVRLARWGCGSRVGVVPARPILHLRHRCLLHHRQREGTSPRLLWDGKGARMLYCIVILYIICKNKLFYDWSYFSADEQLIFLYVIECLLTFMSLGEIRDYCREWNARPCSAGQKAADRLCLSRVRGGLLWPPRQARLRPAAWETLGESLVKVRTSDLNLLGCKLSAEVCQLLYVNCTTIINKLHLIDKVLYCMFWEPSVTTSLKN